MKWMLSPPTLREDWEDLLREWMPYGMWTLEDKVTEILFNRKYEPRWKRTRVIPAFRVADRKWWVPNIVTQQWFYADDDAPWLARRTNIPKHYREAGLAARQRCELALEAFLLGHPINPDWFIFTKHMELDRETNTATSPT